MSLLYTSLFKYQACTLQLTRAAGSSLTSAHLVSWPSTLRLPLARRAPRQLHTWHSRSAPSFALHQRGPALPLAVRRHRAHPPGRPTACHRDPRWGTGAGGALRGRPLPPCPVRPAAAATSSAPAPAPLEGLDGLVPRDGAVTSSETSETTPAQP